MKKTISKNLICLLIGVTLLASICSQLELVESAGLLPIPTTAFGDNQQLHLLSGSVKLVTNDTNTVVDTDKPPKRILLPANITITEDISLNKPIERRQPKTDLGVVTIEPTVISEADEIVNDPNIGGNATKIIVSFKNKTVEIFAGEKGSIKFFSEMMVNSAPTISGLSMGLIMVTALSSMAILL